MKHDRITLTPSFILHRRPFRETSYLLETWSREYGRVGIVAKGAKRRKSPWQALLQPFVPLLLGWGGRGELKNLVDVEFNGASFSLPKGRGLVSAFYVNELMMKLLAKEDPHPQLYDAYEQALSQLCDLPSQDPSSWQLHEQRILRLFEKSLLKEIGFGLVLNVDANGVSIDQEKHYRYGLEAGPIEYHGGQEEERISGKSLQAYDQEILDDEATLAEIKRLNRYVLNAILENATLHSRRLWRNWQNAEQSADASSAKKEGNYHDS